MTDGTAGRVVVLDVLGLQEDHLQSGRAPNLAALLSPDDGGVAPLQPPFPALTVPVQTTLGEGRSPRSHGDVASGEYDRERDEVTFWDRSREDRDRIWEAASDDAGLTTGALFFQHLIGSTADVVVTPSPIEDEDNNLIEMNCWTNPDGFYDELREEFGHFPLLNYWGPMANEESTEWIFGAARETVDRFDPDLLWVYVPHLDYDGQRHGPSAGETLAQVEVVDALVGEFLDHLREDDRWDETVVNVLGEYGFHDVDTPLFPNRALRDAGLLVTQDDGEGGLEVNLAESSAFAVVDHQLAHVYADEGAVTDAREALSWIDGIDVILGPDGKRERGIDHPNAGELVLLAESNAWFQYYWWTDHDDAPAYATNTDIHAKPGFDPCELFPGERGIVSLDPQQVGGSHGRADLPALYGLGGPAAPDSSLPERVDPRAVAPTIADLLGIADDVDMAFEASSLLDERG